MARDGFKIIFEHMDKEMKEQAELQADTIRCTLEQNVEIKKLIEIINDTIPTDEPLLYSRSSYNGAHKQCRVHNN